MEGYQQGGGGRRIREKVEGIRSINGRHKNRQGDVKNSMGNGEAKELVFVTQEHELNWGNDGCCEVQGEW